MKEYITPGIVIDGETYTPAGWMYILGFALGGCKWAIEKANTDEFKETVLMYKTKEEAEWINSRIDRITKELEELKTK